MCDQVIVTNEYLASRVKHCVDKPVTVIPNFLNDEQMRVSRQIYEEKKRRGFARTGQIHLGYFSGTPTHNKDFEIISGILSRMLERDPRLVVRIVGFLDLKEPLRSYQSRIEFYPLQDFVNLQQLIGSVEVNLVPLQDNIFTNCKSELKYFEAGVTGTVTIASPSFTLARAIQDGENGYIARSFEWHEKLEYVLDNMDSYAVMAEKAFLHSEENYCWENQVDRIEATLFG
jgi:glycosyltransferase involved in cell wall biosynthesis